MNLCVCKQQKPGDAGLPKQTQACDAFAVAIRIAGIGHVASVHSSSDRAVTVRIVVVNLIYNSAAQQTAAVQPVRSTVPIVFDTEPTIAVPIHFDQHGSIQNCKTVSQKNISVL